MLNLLNDREKIDTLLEKIVTMHNLEAKKHMASSLCTGAAIAASKQLLENEGKSICPLISI